MAKIEDAARFLVDMAQASHDRDAGDLMTNLRLQKLLYFTQGWSLALRGVPLFDGEFVAWNFGPVHPAAYRIYKPCGSNGIVGGNPTGEGLTDEERALMIDVLVEYDGYSTSKLVSMTHEAGTPWAQAGKGGQITNAAMEAYFKTLPELLTFDAVLDQLPVEVL